MADDFATALAEAIQKRADDTDLPRMPRRSPDDNTPFQAETRRAERRTRPTYRDPVASEAVGNIDRQRKKEKKQ